MMVMQPTINRTIIAEGHTFVWTGFIPRLDSTLPLVGQLQLQNHRRKRNDGQDSIMHGLELPERFWHLNVEQTGQLDASDEFLALMAHDFYLRFGAPKSFYVHPDDKDNNSSLSECECQKEIPES